jgi:hypothetical protein
MNIFDFILTMPDLLTTFADTVWNVLSFQVDLPINIFGLTSVSGMGLIFGVGLSVIVTRRIIGAVAT